MASHETPANAVSNARAALSQLSESISELYRIGRVEDANRAATLQVEIARIFSRLDGARS